MHIIGPSSVALTENEIQEMVHQSFFWYMLMYDKNEKERKDCEPISLSWRVTVAALYCVTYSIHSRNTAPPEKEMNVVCFTLLCS